MKMLPIITILLVSLTSTMAQAQSSQTDREIIERLTRIETQMAAMNTRIDDLRSELKGDIEGLKGELKGDIEGLKGELKGDIVDLRSLVYVTLGGIMTLMCGLLAMMGYVMWDRRTAITPVVKKTKELEQVVEEEKAALRKVLKGYALVEPRFAEVLRVAGIL